LNKIDFTNFWNHFVKIFGQAVEKGHSFIKLLLHVTEYNTKIPINHAMRICDWLQSADAQWIGEGFQKSFFVQHYVGEKTKEEVLNDGSHEAKGSDYVAILYWDRSDNTFAVMVKCLTDKNKYHHYFLKSQEIASTHKKGLEKEAREKLSTQRYKKSIPVWFTSSLFNRVKPGGGGTTQMYTTTGGAGASIYVY